VLGVGFLLTPWFQMPRLDKAVNGGARDADDLGDGRLGYLLLQEDADLSPLSRPGAIYPVSLSVVRADGLWRG